MKIILAIALFLPGVCFAGKKGCELSGEQIDLVNGCFRKIRNQLSTFFVDFNGNLFAASITGNGLHVYNSQGGMEISGDQRRCNTLSTSIIKNAEGVAEVMAKGVGSRGFAEEMKKCLQLMPAQCRGSLESVLGVASANAKSEPVPGATK